MSNFCSHGVDRRESKLCPYCEVERLTARWKASSDMEDKLEARNEKLEAVLRVAKKLDDMDHDIAPWAAIWDELYEVIAETEETKHSSQNQSTCCGDATHGCQVTTDMSSK